MIFKFAEGSHLSGNAQVVGTTLMDIRNTRGRLTAGDVVAEAKPKKSTLHEFFEWDDKTAAYQHRLEQARHLIRSVVITETDEHGEIQPIRAFAKINMENVNSYEPIHKVLSDKEMRDQLLRECKGEITSMRDRLKSYEELSDVIGALDTAEAAIASKIEVAEAA